jgi:ribosomal protein L23
MKNVLKGICYTEKFTALSSTCNQYVFDVDRGSTKGALVEVMQSAFNVKVEAVNIIRRDGKNKKKSHEPGSIWHDI